ncbi:HD domain-containing protein [Candidatus Uhrbacteria bacterium]|nr:HD domain-containing protein [Candidatus Uhrbacteria bacterium]
MNAPLTDLYPVLSPSFQTLEEALAYEAAPLPAWTKRVLSFDKRGWSRAQELFSRQTMGLDRLLQAPPVQRLSRLYQFGSRDSPAICRPELFVLAQEHGRTMHTFRHTRLMHSTQVAATNLSIGICLGLPDAALLVLVCAGLLHDVGHSVESHYGDELLMHWGRAGHEARGKAIVVGSPSIRDPFERLGVSCADVLHAIDEVGGLGSLQKISDTLAYLGADGRLVGWPLPEGFVERLIRSIKSVDNQGIHVHDPAPMLALLERRAHMWRGLYHSARSQRAGGAYRLVLQELDARGLFDRRSLENGDDLSFHSLLRTRLSLHRLSAHVPAWIDAYLRLADMDFSLVDRERVEVVVDADAARALMSDLQRLDEKPFLLEPQRYTRKSYNVWHEGEPGTLRAPDSLLAPEDKQFRVVWYPV